MQEDIKFERQSRSKMMCRKKEMENRPQYSNIRGEWDGDMRQKPNYQSFGKTLFSSCTECRADFYDFQPTDRPTEKKKYMKINAEESEPYNGNGLWEEIHQRVCVIHFNVILTFFIHLFIFKCRFNFILFLVFAFGIFFVKKKKLHLVR